MTQAATNSTHDQNLTRSAIAPEIRAGVMTANISWNITNAVAGNASDPGHATGGGPVTAAPTNPPIVLDKPANSPPPTRPPKASLPNAQL